MKANFVSFSTFIFKFFVYVLYKITDPFWNKFNYWKSVISYPQSSSEHHSLFNNYLLSCFLWLFDGKLYFCSWRLSSSSIVLKLHPFGYCVALFMVDSCCFEVSFIIWWVYTFCFERLFYFSFINIFFILWNNFPSIKCRLKT